MNYTLIYDQLIARAQTRTLDKGEWHHILPKSMGGSDDESNLVHLTYREHYIAHVLLYKIYDNDKMRYALNRMRNSKTDYGRTSRFYEIGRTEHRKTVSKWAKSYMHDKVMMRNVITGKCKILKRDGFDPAEWKGVNLGRGKPNEKLKGTTCFKDKDGNIYRLDVNDPLISQKGLVGVGNPSKATLVAQQQQLARLWYAKKPISSEVVLLIPSLFDWYKTHYDPSRYKATGVAAWRKTNGIKFKSKLFTKAFDEFKSGWKLDSDFYEVYNEIHRNPNP